MRREGNSAKLHATGSQKKLQYIHTREIVQFNISLSIKKWPYSIVRHHAAVRTTRKWQLSLSIIIKGRDRGWYLCTEDEKQYEKKSVVIFGRQRRFFRMLRHQAITAGTFFFSLETFLGGKGPSTLREGHQRFQQHQRAMIEMLRNKTPKKPVAKRS